MRARPKLTKEARSKIMGKGKGIKLPRALCSRYFAVIYNPKPKKAADPRETYLVMPEKKCQLIDNASHRRIIRSTDK